jgi:hypothetical protein
MPPKKAALGQQGKAVGCVPPTALLFEHSTKAGSQLVAAAATVMQR